MERTKIELNRVKIGALFGLIISILMILLAIYFTPDYVASNLSPDGVVELETIATIKMFRTAVSTIGIIGLLVAILFFVKPYLFNSLANYPAISTISNSYLEMTIGIFLILALIMGLRPTIKSIIEWQNIVGNHDAHELRIKFHRGYRRDHVIREFIQSKIPHDEPLLIKADNYQKAFFAYYLAPRPIYYYSDIFAAELDKAGRKYHVLTITCEKSKDIEDVEWSITEGKSMAVSTAKRGETIKE